MSLTLTDQDRTTLRTAADAVGSPHKVATEGSIALATATGPIGHVLAAKTKDISRPYPPGPAQPHPGRHDPQDHRSPRRRLMR